MMRKSGSARFASDVDGALHPRLCLAEELQIAPDLTLVAGRLCRIVGQFDGLPAVRAGHLADQRDGGQLIRLDRGTVLEIICQIGAPAKSHADLAAKVTIRLLNRIDVQ